MYSEFDKVSVIDMSNSDLFFLEKDQDSIELTFLLRPKQEFSKEMTSPIASSEVAQEETHQKQQQQEDENEGQVVDKINDHGKDNNNNNNNNNNAVEERKMPSLGDLEVEDDDDGFRTPTSLEYKIPVMAQCPPAPKKPKTLPSTKRKFSSDAYFDVFDEIGMLFTPVLNGVDRKIKKVRAPSTTSM